jgi:hypothetical protein
METKLIAAYVTCAVTMAGLILKTTLFVLAYSFGKYAVPPTEASFDTPTTSALRTSGARS